MNNGQQLPAALTFTGERFTPECVREICYEHWHRYVFARELVRGKRVLDAACGEGYGAALLAPVAHFVTGVDISAQAIDHARQRYGAQQNLRFECADACALPLAEASQDVVVSFETLEHLIQQEALIAGFARVLVPAGILIISSPDKRTYSELSGFHNEFHVRELYREELLALLQPHFPYIRLFGQKLLFQSVIWSLENTAASAAQLMTGSQGMERVEQELHYEPLYFVAVCSKQPLDMTLPALALFGDREESVYQHYNHEVRKNMMAGARIAELEAALMKAELERDNLHIALEEIKQETATTPSRWWQRLLSRR